MAYSWLSAEVVRVGPKAVTHVDQSRAAAPFDFARLLRLVMQLNGGSTQALEPDTLSQRMRQR